MKKIQKIACNLEAFKQYIHDSSVGLFSKESNAKHDWNRKMQGRLNADGRTYGFSIRENAAEAWPNSETFHFNFDLLLTASVTKEEAREMVCRIADDMQFHPNIKVTDNGRSGDDRHFCVKPKGFGFNQFTHDYCWDEVPERADIWSANILMNIQLTPPTSDGWGRSFDLNPDPVNLLRCAIRNRDEEIARKEAERKAKEEAERLASEKAERELQEAYERLEGFLESIGDFVILDDGVLKPMKEMWIESNGDGDILLLGNRGREPFRLSLVNGFDENVKKIIKWMVENGARDTELKSEVA